MATLHPTFEFTEDAMVHIAENLLTGGRSMKHCPATNLRVEVHQETLHRRVKILSENGFDPRQKSLHVLTRRLDYQLAAAFLERLGQGIEAFLYVRNPGFTL